ncbi:MAG: 16S rRNA (uracil(1498)-N(3))-methyltransferase [Clostridia bacterium]|nr:16S rRNA (uracil(1498)-N(3))-methyltransferase [Clostridia bacterium]
MDLKRFFTDDTDEVNSSIKIWGEEFVHAVKVTRHKVGYKLIVNNNTPFDYYCTIVKINKDHLEAKIDKIIKNDSENAIPVRLYIGVNKDLDTVVQKAVELGVQEIIPFYSAHSNVSTIHYDRINKIILESAKQCGRAVLPTLHTMVSLSQALKEAEGTDILFFYEGERSNRVSDVRLIHNEVSIFIGPEGGFSCEEVQMFSGAESTVLTLGKRILRVATAVVSAFTLVNQKLSEL